MKGASEGDESVRRAVLFDFGGTLDGDGVHWPRRFHAAYREAGGTLGRHAFEDLFRAVDKSLVELPGIRAMGQRAAIAAAAALLLERLPDGAKVDVVRIIDTLHRSVLAAVARNRPMLERLAGRYALGVVSNFTGNLVPCLEELDLMRFFGYAADSTVLGVAKPSEAIFLLTLDALEVEPEQAWMVGDNAEADIRPAQRLGMRTCWLTPEDRPLPSGLSPTARISRLTDLEPVLA